MKLKQSRVKFYEQEHEYWLEGKQLSGITSLLSRQLFPSTYANIPESVLLQAQQRGSRIHNDIELFDSIGANIQSEEIEAYKKIKKLHNLTTLDNEYVVSDNEYYATCIDIVFSDFSLCDIKTTSKIHVGYVSWQLSICAYLFELQNPELKAGKLYVLWVPKANYGKPSLIEVDRVPSEEVIRLLECDRKGMQYVEKKPEIKINNDLKNSLL